MRSGQPEVRGKTGPYQRLFCFPRVSLEGSRPGGIGLTRDKGIKWAPSAASYCTQGQLRGLGPKCLAGLSTGGVRSAWHQGANWTLPAVEHTPTVGLEGFAPSGIMRAWS